MPRAILMLVVLAPALLSAGAPRQGEGEAEKRRDAVFQLVNQVRGRAKAPPFKRNAQLDAAAQAHAEAMARDLKFGDGNAPLAGDDKTPEDRAKAGGYRGEVKANVAVIPAELATADGRPVLRHWSEGASRGRILDAAYTETGVGAAYSKEFSSWHYCQIYGKPRAK